MTRHPSPTRQPRPGREQGAAVPLVTAQPVTSGNLKVELLASGALALTAVDTGKLLFVATPSLEAKSGAAYLSAGLVLTPGDATERIYGLGQGNWTAEGGCPRLGLGFGLGLGLG